MAISEVPVKIAFGVYTGLTVSKELLQAISLTLHTAWLSARSLLINEKFTAFSIRFSKCVNILDGVICIYT